MADGCEPWLLDDLLPLCEPCDWPPGGEVGGGAPGFSEALGRGSVAVAAPAATSAGGASAGDAACGSERGACDAGAAGGGSVETSAELPGGGGAGEAAAGAAGATLVPTPAPAPPQGPRLRCLDARHSASCARCGPRRATHARTRAAARPSTRAAAAAQAASRVDAAAI
jgi:hypothetical protein